MKLGVRTVRGDDGMEISRASSRQSLDEEEEEEEEDDDDDADEEEGRLRGDVSAASARVISSSVSV